MSCRNSINDTGTFQNSHMPSFEIQIEDMDNPPYRALVVLSRAQLCVARNQADITLAGWGHHQGVKREQIIRTGGLEFTMWLGVWLLTAQGREGRQGADTWSSWTGVAVSTEHWTGPTEVDIKKVVTGFWAVDRAWKKTHEYCKTHLTGIITIMSEKWSHKINSLYYKMR